MIPSLIKHLNRYRADLIVIFGFFILPLLLFAPMTIGGQTMLPVDNLFQWAPWSTAVLAPAHAPPQNGLLSDLILENYAWKKFINDSLAQGEIPLWNPNLFAGTPFLATGQHSAYYPFSILFLILPIAQAYGWFTVSQLWLAGLFTYFWARILKQRRASAAIAGLIFQGCGFLLVSSAVFPMILAGAVWLPLLLACIEMLVRQTTAEGDGVTLPWAVLGAVALGTQILAGHIEITYYTLLVMAAYAAWRLVSRLLHKRRQADPLSWPSLLRPSLWLLAFVIIGLMLGAVQFIPFVEVGQANFREGSATLAEVRGWAFPPRRILTLALPDFFGSPADHTYFDLFDGRSVPFTTNYQGEPNPHGSMTSNWGIKNYVEGGIYLGILPLILAALGLYAFRSARGRRSEIGFLAILAFFSLAFIFGTPLYAILYYGLPGINQLHSPFRWVFPFSLAIALLAGYGFDYLIERAESERPLPHRWRWLIPGRQSSFIPFLAGLIFWAGLLLWLVLGLSFLFYEPLEPLLTRLFLGLAQARDAFPSTQAFYSYQFVQLLILGGLLLGSGLILRLSCSPRAGRGKYLLWQLLAALLIGGDLLLAGYGFAAAVDTELLAYQPETLRWLQEQPGLWRLTTFTPKGDKPLNANTPWIYDLQDVRGYDSVILKQYTDYMAAIEPQNELQFNRVQPVVNWQSLNSPLLDLLGVKYIISSELIELPKLELVQQIEGLYIYENLAMVPRAYTLPRSATAVVPDPLTAMQQQDPRQFLFIEQDEWPGQLPASPTPATLAPAEIIAYGNIEVTAQATIDQPAWLVLNDTYFTGWDAFIRPVSPRGEPGEEEQVELFRVNGNFRGVQLEPGRWQVRFRYSPLTFKLGGLISFMGGIILIFAMLVWGWRRFYNPQGQLTNTHSIAKNSLVPMALNLFNRGIDFAFAAFYLRLLGPVDTGRYFTAIIIAGWFEIISNFGLNTWVIREVSQNQGQASRYLFNSTIVRIGTGLLGALPVLLYMGGIDLVDNPLDSQTTLAVFLIMAGMLFSGMGQGLTGLYYAFEKAEFPAAITTVTTILKVAFGVLVLLLGYSFIGLAAVSILVNLITLAILVVSAIRHFKLKGPWQLDFGLQKQMVKQSYPLMLNHLLAVVFFQIDVPLLRQFNGEAVVGWYNSAYKWINAFNVIPSFFTFALFPVISRQVQAGLPDARRTFHLSLKLMVLIAFPLAALTMVLAPLLIGILGGEQFLPHGAIALQLVVWSIPIGWINSVTNYVLIALGQERRLTWAFIAGVTFNTVANLIFLSRYSYVAASITTILSEVILLVAFAYYLKPVMPGVRWGRILLRPLAITAAMLWGIWLGSQVNMGVALFVGLLIYPLGLWQLKVFGVEEKQILNSLLPASLAQRLNLVTEA